MKKIELRMAGQVLVLLPEERAEGAKLEKVECLVVGGEHRAYLSVPMGAGNLECSVTMPEPACVFVDAESRQYAMIDVTGYSLSIGPAGDGVTLGPLGDVIDSKDFIGPVDKGELKSNRVAAKLTLTNGTLSQRARVGLARSPQDSKRVFDQVIAAELSLALEPVRPFVIQLKSEIATYEIKLIPENYRLLGSDGSLSAQGVATITKEFAAAGKDAQVAKLSKLTAVATKTGKDLADDTLVIFLTSLCGWVGAGKEFIDFDDLNAILPPPDESDESRFPGDIEFYSTEIHPKTGTCPPKIVTFK
jgi:hypothetical protein